jgi:hypothetical protein
MFEVVWTGLLLILAVVNLWTAKTAYKDKRYSSACVGCFVSGICFFYFFGVLFDVLHLIGG